jgi:hypothetical protein
MKKYLLAFAMGFCALSMKAQVIRTVSNVADQPGMYKTVKAAMDAANPGDVLLIQGSSTSYGNIHITKPISLIGTGHNPQKQIAYTSTADSITVAADVAKVNVSGLCFHNFNYSDKKSNTNLDQVRIDYCAIKGKIYFAGDCNNWMIRNCIFNEKSSITSATTLVGRSKLMITNNFFYDSSINNLGDVPNVVLSNNLFVGNPNTVATNSVLSYMEKSLIQNNIFYQTNTSGKGMKSCVYQNNMSYKATDGSFVIANNVDGGGNFANTNPEFANYKGGMYTIDTNLRLKTTSPGHHKGTGGEGDDIGLYGGGTTFSMTGEPDIPQVRRLVVNTNMATQTGNKIQVTLKSSKADPK